MAAGSKTRLVKGALLGGLAFVVLFALANDSRKPPEETLTPGQIQRLFEAMLKRVAKGGPNHLHMRRLYYYAPAFSGPAGANVDAVRAGALLHDSTKEDGEGEPKFRFCTHGEQGSAYAEKVLGEIGTSKAFAAHVGDAVLRHMGPCGFNWGEFDDRFMTKFCGRSYPEPKSREAKVLYDIDMLDLMTVDGVVKVVELRQTNPEFEKEPLKESALTGKDSAWRSVVDAEQTLLTRAAKQCGARLVAHTRAFLDGVDWGSVKDVPAFKAAALSYLGRAPLPDCLPAVPVCGDPETALEEGPESLCRRVR